jgi:hypothetical protein
MSTRILLDTNVWRYLVDSDGLEAVYRAAKGADGAILACPAVLYEMLRCGDLSLRQRLVKAICRSRWIRMMPEAYEESMELLQETRRLRPLWLITSPNLREFNQLHADWRGERGVWWRARRDAAEAGSWLEEVEGDLVSRARGGTVKLREEMRGQTPFERMELERWTATFPQQPAGWDGKPVETWRAMTLQYFASTLLTRDGAYAPVREWLQPWLDVRAIRGDLASLTRLILHDTDARRMPRNWLRWAVATLQATRATSPGSAVDNQIGSYLVDADVFVTADKVFAAIVQRLRTEAPVPIARARLVTSANCAAILAGLVSGSSEEGSSDPS